MWVVGFFQMQFQGIDNRSSLTLLGIDYAYIQKKKKKKKRKKFPFALDSGHYFELD